MRVRQKAKYSKKKKTHVTLTGKKGSCILGLLLASCPISKFFLGKDQKNTYTCVWS